MAAGMAATGEVSSAALVQPEPGNAASVSPAEVVADQVVGTDNLPTVAAWPTPADTGAPPERAGPVWPASIDPPALEVRPPGPTAAAVPLGTPGPAPAELMPLAMPANMFQAPMLPAAAV